MPKEKTERLAHALLLPINPALVVLLGFYTVVWGFWLANPFWTVFTQAPLFGKMASIMPEAAWGLVAVFAGVIIVYGAVRRSYGALTRGAVVAFMHWFIIACLYFWGDPSNTGGITALTISIYAAVVYLNIRVNFKEDPDKEEGKSLPRL